MTTRSHRFAALAAAAALTVGLAACTSDEAEEEATGEATTQASATETASADAQAEDLATCIVGTWDADDSLLPPNNVSLEDGVEAEGSASLSLTFDETTVTVEESSDVTYSGEDDELGAVSRTEIVEGTATLEYTTTQDTITYGELLSAEGSATSTTTQGEEDPTTEEVDYADTVASQADSERGATCTAETLTLTLTINDETAQALYHRR